jgi:hypothetical protein
MRRRNERARNRRPVYLEALEDRSLLSALKPAVVVGHGPAKTHEVPLKVTITEGFATLLTGEGTGHASHLGKTTMSFVSTSVEPKPDFLLITGTFTLTAANGDTLSGNFTQMFFPPDSSGNAPSTIEFEITDGTGRFLGATGGGTAHTISDLSINPSPFTLTTTNGTISVPRSNGK